ncbi:MAG: type IIA DNA topoisomerase subunit B [Saprospiraceae bacterium]|jgi:topoisomerase-4 subunit B|nr:type IIA DNA topoisomerase subunit B [Saprospiraceae bacterium]MBX7180096.1 type IIA DNA topoisomerase subunit B [Saprospiraceae bacterium]MCB0591765.1 type IIA DNA topoisomerase subunit B [Saprospiraceae bacterium]MCO5282518.1 type IIA DNA topoisomerase subunit B [Saprospiraceae bacterium]WKZ62611.1 MAG: DNA topoisomerase IV subunit B [Saprospiraceae bacterium]
MEDNGLLYIEDNIKTLDWKEHIRMRPGMYIGKLGDGQSNDDGIYILIKEIIDNAMDEYFMGHGKEIVIRISGDRVMVRDYGRGIPLGKVIDCVARINTGGKYDSKAFKKSVGLNGVGTKAVNALSESFTVQSFRDGRTKKADFSKGELVKDYPEGKTDEKNGTIIEFTPDNDIFRNFHFREDIVEPMLWNYAYLNSGLKINFNGKTFVSKNGLADMIAGRTNPEELIYEPIHLTGDDIEIVLTHGHQYGEQYYSFVNGQNTTQGGTHLNAFREAVVKVLRDFYKKDYDARDVRTSIIAAVSIRVEEPIFESQTKTKLGSTLMGPDQPSIRTYIMDFLSKELDNFLHKNLEVAGQLQKKILQSERERKEIADIKKEVNKKAKKANIHNKKLRDCRIHLNDKGGTPEQKENSMLFITEGDSASGSITKARDPFTQAVFSLRGKPLNCYGMTKKIVYQNEEFNLLQHALNIENDIDDLRYNKVVISTDADVDGMHIRLLLLTFFLQFFPDLVRNGHLYILDTPLFRVRDKKTTIYCYSESEKLQAIEKLRGKPEITRFKGLGEISPEEFGGFIGKDIRLSPVMMKDNTDIEKILEYYMGKNTPERQIFIVENLRVERDD